MSDLAQELLELKRVVRKSEDDIKENRGAIKQLKRELKSKFKISTTEEARARMKKLSERWDSLTKEGEKLEQQIHKILEAV